MSSVEPGVDVAADTDVAATAPIRVVLVDDQSMVRAGFRMLLSAEDDIVVVGEAADGREAVEVVTSHRPDVVLMDVRMPRVDGLSATAEITADPALADTKVVVLTTFQHDDYVFGALRAGASGFLLKDAEPQFLVDAVRIVAGGQSLLAPSVTRLLIEQFVAGAPASPERSAARTLDELTPREIEVLTLIGQGRSNTEIADVLVLSPLTVKTHISRLLSKLAARDRAQLVIAAYEARLVGDEHGV